MNTFKYNRELDVNFLHERFGSDTFSAREILGSFVEATEHQLSIMESALERRQLAAFARIAGRVKDNLKIVGLHSEHQAILELRAHLASQGADSEFERRAKSLLDILIDKNSLLKIEVQRLDQHIERVAHS